ncbi:MAG: ribonuclease HII [Candidatus Diapherotrites archaeon]
MLIAGIDEAGRGPALGPLVMAVACIAKENEEKLIEIGVKDSKLLSLQQREIQLPQIKKVLNEFEIVKIEAAEIDELRNRQSLNEIEAMKAGALLNSLKVKPDVVYVDAPDVIAHRFGARIAKYISFPVEIKSEHKADLNYPIVSAASVIAKTTRDDEIKKLIKKYGEMGSGYPHDPVTINFINKWTEEKGGLPPFARASWDTNKKILDNQFQSKLGEYDTSK